jgi:hypothetical protein
VQPISVAEGYPVGYIPIAHKVTTRATKGKSTGALYMSHGFHETCINSKQRSFFSMSRILKRVSVS